ncbi:MmgE/PrpD family protein [Hydrogenophaga sp. BPS33]|uniref:MmgE/PrpD family protein n=1 Tax=Hydrogenophaga sp. BPS33 TaxID=2651974 RepID=UPI00132013DF|nr:MmgE/PrpD family protein [Hydrogenophaga sp. BPS33]QHE84693.1 MmgE/PrpD family protein [Hydrogenophaga sp. BPS33]
MEETRKLARFASELAFDSIPKEVVSKAKLLILDQIGAMLGAATLPWSRSVLDYVLDWGGVEGNSTVAYFGTKTRLELAAFANACFGHGFEIDDLYVRGQSHPGCVVIPTAIAACESQAGSGRDLLTAVVAGYEVMGRINHAIMPSCAEKGFHAATSVTGPFGAAIAAGKLHRLDAGLMVHAMSIAGSHASGTIEYDQGGGSVKRVHAGIAAAAGVRSVLLAKHGITGPATILEGKHGICHVFADSCDLGRLTRGLGTDFPVVTGTGFKAYCCCAGMHSGIEALQNLMWKHSMDAAAVKSITMGTHSRALSHISAEATDITSAQFSARFGLAVRMLRGANGFSEYTPETLRDPAIRALMERIALERDEVCDSEWPKTRGARVRIVMSDGRQLEEKVDYYTGMEENPMSDDAVRTKFMTLLGPLVPERQLTEILSLVTQLEDAPDLLPLARLLCVPDGPRDQTPSRPSH